MFSSVSHGLKRSNGVLHTKLHEDDSGKQEANYVTPEKLYEIREIGSVSRQVVSIGSVYNILMKMIK